MYSNESGNDYISLSVLKVFEGFRTEEQGDHSFQALRRMIDAVKNELVIY